MLVAQISLMCPRSQAYRLAGPVSMALPREGDDLPSLHVHPNSAHAHHLGACGLSSSIDDGDDLYDSSEDESTEALSTEMAMLLEQAKGQPPLTLKDVQSILDDSTNPVGRLLRELNISAEDALRLDILTLLQAVPRKERQKYGKRRKLSEVERLELNRNRNREHARCTRRRRKMFMEALQVQVDRLHKRLEPFIDMSPPVAGESDRMTVELRLHMARIDSLTQILGGICSANACPTAGVSLEAITCLGTGLAERLDALVTPDFVLSIPTMICDDLSTMQCEGQMLIQPPGLGLGLIGPDALARASRMFGEIIQAGLIISNASDIELSNFFLSIKSKNACTPRCTKDYDVAVSATKALFSFDIVVRLRIRHLYKPACAETCVHKFAAMGRAVLDGPRLSNVDLRFDPKALVSFVQTNSIMTKKDLAHVC